VGLLDKLKKAWNAFINDESSNGGYGYYNYGYSTTVRPDRVQLSISNERSVITAVYNRIAIDVASLYFKHVQLDDNGRYVKDVKSNMNRCFTLESNKDQSAKAFFHDVVMSLFDEGCIAIVPVDTTKELNEKKETTAFDILSMRTGRIMQWYPDYVQMEVYNDRTGLRQTITMPKSEVAIIENPFYAVMNDRNSTLQRLIRKLNILDAIEEQSGAGKLDLIIQLPYVVRTKLRKDQAKERIDDITNQLSSSKYGIAYTDGTEKITQLNRPVENNVLKSVEYLTSMLFSQLGMSQSILDGTANEETMNNYRNTTVIPIADVLVEEMARKWLTPTAITQGKSIMYFYNPFKYIPLSKLAEVADKLTRNAIVSSNEMRQTIGLPPSNDPEADKLSNKNISKSETETVTKTENEEVIDDKTNQENM